MKILCNIGGSKKYEGKGYVEFKLRPSVSIMRLQRVLRPPLNKKRVSCPPGGQKTASPEVGIFFLIAFVYKLECTGGKREKKKVFEK